MYKNASYLITSTGIRYDSNGRHELFWLPKSAKSSQKKLNPQIIAERADIVFQLMPERMKNLVIVNGNLETFETIQACVKVAEKYADNIMVIPPLLARMMYAIDDIAKLRLIPPSDETILVVTINHAFIDFVILQRNENFELNIIQKEMFKPKRDICMEEFARIYDYYYPHATVILVEGDFAQLAQDIREEFNPRNLFNRYYNRWDYLLMSGALLRVPDGNQRYHIPNFSMGVETTILGRNIVLLPERSRIPCKIYGCAGKPCSTTLYYSPEHYHLFENLRYEKMKASKNSVGIMGSPNEIIGYYDDRGVPYLTAIKPLKEDENLFVKKKPANSETPYTSTTPKEKTMERETDRMTNTSNDSILNVSESSGLSSIFEQPTTSAPEITFKFVGRNCAVEIYQKKKTEKIKDSVGNEWTPLYLSMADGKPEIGRKAKSDYQRFPKYVIYDVLKIIGKPLNKIESDPKWGFELVENNGIVYFQIETPSGPRLIPQEIVISAFIKAMKLRIESFWGAENEFNGFHLSTNFILLKSQKAIFEKAAAKNFLNILSFVVTDSE